MLGLGPSLAFRRPLEIHLFTKYLLPDFEWPLHMIYPYYVKQGVGPSF